MELKKMVSFEEVGMRLANLFHMEEREPMSMVVYEGGEVREVIGNA